MLVSHSLLTSNFDDGVVDQEQLAFSVRKIKTLLDTESQKLKEGSQQELGLYRPAR